MKRKLLLVNLLIALCISQGNLFAMMSPTQDTLSRVQTGSFIAYVEIEPSYDTLDAVIGLSQIAAVSPSEMSAVVNCNNGIFQVYKGDGAGGGTYDRDSTVLTLDSVLYTLKFDVNVVDKTYSVSIDADTLDGEVLIAENYPFRAQADTLAIVSGMYFGEDSLVVADVWTEWESWPLAAPVNGALLYEWDVVPTEDVVDVMLGLTGDAPRTYGDYSPIVIFSPGWGNMEMKARNGDVYDADTVLAYVNGTSYHIAMKVNVTTNTYDVVVTPEGGGDYMLAKDYGFRKEVSELKYWGYKDHPVTATVEQLEFSSTNEDMYSWTLGQDEPLTGDFRVGFDATPMYDIVDCFIFLNDNMPLAEWWSHINAGIVFGGQGSDKIKIRNGSEYTADSLISYAKDSKIHFDFDFHLDADDNANNVYSVTATSDGGDPILIAEDYAFRNVGNSIAYYFVKDFSTPQLLDEVMFENFEVGDIPSVGDETATHDTLSRVQTASFIAMVEITPTADTLDAVIGLSKIAAVSPSEMATVVNCNGGIFQVYKGDGAGGGSYDKDADVLTLEGVKYTLKFDVNVIDMTYSVYIDSDTLDSEVLLAENYPFRAQLDTLTIVSGMHWGDEALLIGDVWTEWESWALAAPVNGALVFEWDVVPTDTVVDVLLGLTEEAPRGYGDFSPIVIFSPSWGNNEMKARNGDTYDADTVLAYEIGTSYHIVMKVNVTTNTYDVIVTPEGEGDYMIATDYAFRKQTAELKYWGYKDHPVMPTVEQLSFNSTNQDMFSWTLDVDEPLTGDFSIDFDATPMYDVVDCFIFFNDNMPLAEWWSHINAGILFGGQGSDKITVRNGGEYTADSLISYVKGQKIHFSADFHVDADNSANNVYSVTATVEGENPILIAKDYAYRNPGENIAYYFVKDFATPQLLDEVMFENFEVAITTGIDKKDQMVDGFGLSQNYPNPFSQITNISYSLAEPGHVRIVVYSLSGVKMATLVDSDVVSGSHTVEFDASGIESGIYLYKFETEHYSSVRRMMLID